MDLAAGCAQWNINTPKRVAAFLATIAHESGELRYVREIASGEAYEGRKDLGNTEPGDGTRYRGRGLIQLTGRYNYRKASEALGTDYEAYPELLERDTDAALSACWWWAAHGCNELADTGSIETVTKRVNGGLNGIESRRQYYATALQALAQGSTIEQAMAQAPKEAPQSVQPTPIALPTTKPKGSTMAPFIAAAIPALLDLVPTLANLFKGESAVSQRNVAAATVVVNAAKQAIGASNEQELVERIQSDPAAAKEVKSAVEQASFELQEVGGGIAAAREANQQFAETGRSLWANPAFVMSLVLMAFPLMFMADFLYINPQNYSGDLRVQISVMVVGLLVAIAAYWIGTSASSARKTELTALNKREPL